MEGDMEMRILITVGVVLLVTWCVFAYLLPSWESFANTDFNIFAIQELGTLLGVLAFLGFLIWFLFYAYSKIGKTQ